MQCDWCGRGISQPHSVEYAVYTELAGVLFCHRADCLRALSHSREKLNSGEVTV